MVDYIKLKESDCKSCYKCIRHCPVKSIEFANNKANIIKEECILCGECYVVCPQNAKEIKNDLALVRDYIANGEKVIVSLAPSFVANFAGIGIEAMKKALCKLGFFDVEETAIGATIVKNEYDAMLERGEQSVIISSCCSSVNFMIEKHYPEALKYLAPIISPMHAHCRDIKTRYPDAKTCFIGPCIAKKKEADDYCKGDVDVTLTFQALSKWLDEKGVEIEASFDKPVKSRARLFPIVGGILKTMKRRNRDYTYIAIDGQEACISAINDIIAGRVENCFVELSSCKGGCVGGPAMSKFRSSQISGSISVTKAAGHEDFDVNSPEYKDVFKLHRKQNRSIRYPDEYELTEILRKMGKHTADDELNCGACGYNSCREKAIAVYQGKADISMCTPFWRDRAETFSNNILRNSPMGIFVLNSDLEIVQINPAASSIFNIKNPQDLVGVQVVNVLDPMPFLEARDTGRAIKLDKEYLPEFNKYVEMTIAYDKNYKNLLCLMKDNTKEEFEREKKEEISRKTMEITDKVIEKQMRVVQEIASLLGETTAETKIALTRLKESLGDE